MHNPLTTLSKSLDVLRTHLVMLLAMISIDLGFFYGLTRLHYEIFTQISTHMIALSAILEKKAAELTQTELVGLESYLIESPEFLTHYHAIVYYISIFFLGLFILWIVLQGTNAYLAKRMVGYKTPIHQSVLGFAWQSLLAFAVLVGFILITTLALEAMGTQVIPLIGETELTILIWTLVLALAYFLAVAISIDGFKTALRASIHHAKELIPAFLFIIILLGVLLLNGMWMYNLHWAALIIFILLAILPALTLLRVFFLQTTQSLQAHRKPSKQTRKTH